MEIKVKIINRYNKIYTFDIKKENQLDLEFLKSFLLDNNQENLNNLEFIRQCLDMINLLSMEKLGNHYRIEIKDLNIILAINRNLDWDWFEMRALHVNFTKSQLKSFIETLK